MFLCSPLVGYVKKLYGFHWLFISVEGITSIYFIVYLVHTLTVWPFVYMFCVFVLPNILFSTSALYYPRGCLFSVRVRTPESFLLNLNPNQFLLSGLLYFYCNFPPTKKHSQVNNCIQFSVRFRLFLVFINMSIFTLVTDLWFA